MSDEENYDGVVAPDDFDAAAVGDDNVDDAPEPEGDEGSGSTYTQYAPVEWGDTGGVGGGHRIRAAGEPIWGLWGGMRWCGWEGEGGGGVGWGWGAWGGWSGGGGGVAAGRGWPLAARRAGAPAGRGLVGLFVGGRSSWTCV